MSVDEHKVQDNILNSTLLEIKNELRGINASLESFDRRVTRLEASELTNCHANTHVFKEGLTSPDTGSSDDVQGEFLTLKDSLQKVRLPSDLKLNENRQGIKKADLAAFNVISRSARYVETTLKLLANINAHSVSTEDLENVSLVQVAHIKYLQEEFAATVVQSQCPEGVSKWFRTLGKNTSTFSPSVCDRIRAAGDISKATEEPARGRGRGHFRGRGGFRGRQMNGGYHRFLNNSFPPRPQHDDEQ